MTKQITGTTKSMLRDAVHDMTILTDEGNHPTAALVKVAGEYDLTADQTRLVGHAYNTAHTATVRESSDNILDKLATTPIADCEQAVAEIGSKKTAATVDLADVYCTDRSISELKGLTQRIETDLGVQEFVKQAAAKRAKTETLSQGPSLDKLFSDLKYLDGQVKKCAGAAESAHDTLVGSLTTLSKYAGRLSIDERLALKVAAVSCCGKHILALINEAVPTPDSCHNVKVASVNDSLLELIQEASIQAKDLQNKVTTLNKVASCRNKVASLIQKKTTKLAAEDSANLVDLASPVSSLNRITMVDSLLGKKPEPLPAANALQTRFIRHGINTPDHKQKLDKIRTQSIISDMIANDEIISQYDVDEVYKVYNDLKQTAPEAMNRPMIARSFMREALAKGGLLGSYDLNPLMTYDKDIASGNLELLQRRQMAETPLQ